MEIIITPMEIGTVDWLLITALYNLGDGGYGGNGTYTTI